MLGMNSQSPLPTSLSGLQGGSEINQPWSPFLPFRRKCQYWPNIQHCQSSEL